jgi:hypothetical protein
VQLYAYTTSVPEGCGWVINATPLSLYPGVRDLVHICQEAGWTSGAHLDGSRKYHSERIRARNSLAHSQWLYPLVSTGSTPTRSASNSAVKMEGVSWFRSQFLHSVFDFLIRFFRVQYSVACVPHGVVWVPLLWLLATETFKRLCLCAVGGSRSDVVGKWTQNFLV